MPNAQTDVQWDQMTIPGTLARAASLWPDVSALEDGAKTFTFAELAGAVENASRAFIAAGVERGDRVAIWAPNGWRWEVAALGLQCAGGVLVTLNTRFKASEAGYVLEKSGAKLVFTMGEFLGMNYADAIANQDLPELQGTVLIDGESTNGESWTTFWPAAHRCRPKTRRPERTPSRRTTSPTLSSPPAQPVAPRP